MKCVCLFVLFGFFPCICMKCAMHVFFEKVKMGREKEREGLFKHVFPYNRKTSTISGTFFIFKLTDLHILFLQN